VPVSDAGQGRAQRVYRRALTGVWDWRIQHWQAEACVLDGDLGVTILLLAIQNYPRDASEFIGHRDRHHISIGAGLEFSEPRTKRMTISSHSVLDGPTTVNEQSSEIFIAVLADAQKLRLAARGTLLRNQAEPGGELSSARERCAISNRGYDGCSDQHADAGDGDQPLTRQVLGSDHFDFVIEPFDLFLYGAPLFRDQAQQTIDSRAQVLLGIGQQSWQHSAEPLPTCSYGYPALEEKCSELIN